MFVIHDYSYLKPEEARRKIAIIQHKIITEQFHNEYYLRSAEPERRLKYEIHAYLSGAKREFHGWISIVNDIADWITNNLWEWIKSLWYDTISPTIYGWSSFIWDNVLAVYDKVKDLPDVVSDIIKKAKDIWNYLTGIIYNYLKNAWDTISNIGSIVKSKVGEALNTVWNWLLKLWNNYIKPGVETIIGKFKDIWNSALNYAKKAWEQIVNTYNIVKSAWDNLVEKISGAFERLSKQMSALPQVIAMGFQNAILTFQDVLKTFWSNYLVPFGEQLLERIRAELERVYNFFSSVLDSLLTTLARYAPTTPEKAWNLVKIAVPITVGATAIPYVMAVGGELLHPLKRIGLTEIVSKLQSTFGIETVGAFILGAISGAVIKTPLTYYINAIFRPNLPSFGDVHNMLGRYAFSEEEFKRFMRWYGIDDKYYFIYSELGTSPSPTFTLRMYARYCGLQADVIADAVRKLESPATLDLRTETNPVLAELLRMGRSVEWMKMFIRLMQIEAVRTVRDQYAREILYDYEKGYMSRDELVSELLALQYPENQRQLLLQFAEIRADRRDVEEKIKALQFSVRRGKITLEQFASELAKLGLREDKIVRLVSIEKARAKEDVGTTEREEVRAFGRSTAIKRFREGITTPQELENELRMLGYSDEYIQRLKILALLERDYDYAMTVLKYAKRAYIKKKITREKFIELLRSYGFTPERIMLELSLIDLAYGLGLGEEEVGG